MSEITINLELYKTPGARIFTGRDRGEEVREKSNLNECYNNNDTIIIIIPSDTITINPSFLEEFFKDVVLKFGSEVFLKKSKFQNMGEYKIEPNLATAIERILRKNSGLNRS